MPRTKPIEQDVLVGAGIVHETTTVRFENDHGPEWWICHGDGEIEVVGTAAHALRVIKRRAKRLVETTRTSGVIVTRVQWLNVPEGFEPPG